MTALEHNLQGTNLYLIGMMGAGKSTIGKLLAQQLNYQFFDTDALITQASGSSITQIFAELGEAGFRQIETQTLGQVSAHTRLVVATGGGIITQKLNWSYLHHGLVIWLDASPQTLWNRLKNDASRPLLQDPNPQKKLEDLLEQRKSLYAQADVRVSIEPDHDSIAVMNQILIEIPKVLKPSRLKQSCTQEQLNTLENA
jgi:shikimate kinase